MSKCYVSEEQLREIFKMKFYECIEGFYEWVDTKMEEGEIKRVEFDRYEVSKLDYKPIAKFILGANGNIYNLMGIANKVLESVDKEEKGKEMCDKIRTQAKSYEEALQIIMEYVEVE